ncbi:glycine--tRNA ligase subunit beta [Rickettsiales bacterium]|nr:glycine--tRNA ligase subunit beta [Rickettsiales bacterium]
MAELLLELFSEEIPAGLQKRAADDFVNIFKNQLDKASISCKDLSIFTTPRRITIVIDGVVRAKKSSAGERRGPRVDAPEKAIEGFVKSTGLTKDQLEIRETDKGKFYFATVKTKESKISDVLCDMVQNIISTYTWPKSMRWGSHTIRWVRPLHSIICLFDGDVLPVKFGHISASNKTKGHRFLSDYKSFEVSDFADYKQKLYENYVQIDQNERRIKIKEDSKKQAVQYGLTLKDDPALLDEVTGLVEWPVALIGKIEEKFLDVPQEALISSMRAHQKYFSLVNKEGKLAPYFVVIANIESKDGGKKIVNGNERVLRARLDDAKFFWDKDRRLGLDSRLEDLEKVVFHAKLGTVADKTKRIMALAKLFSVWIPHANLSQVERAAQLCKADLPTEMVGEFPELQGLMGYYYALESKEDAKIAVAIKEHYSPVGPSDACPKEPISIAVALADKIDTLVGLFAVDEKPTGSKDPFALRRAALGVIRIILENNLRMPLRLLFEKSMGLYPKSLLKPEGSGIKAIVKKDVERSKDKYNRIINDLLEFFDARLRALLKEKSVRYDLVDAVFDGGNEDDFTRLILRVKALDGFLKSEDGVNLLAAYKRATNIVVAEEKKDSVTYDSSAEKQYLREDVEKALYKSFGEVSDSIKKSLKKDQFKETMQSLSLLRSEIDAFFEGVKVNCDDKDVRKNRLLILAQFRNLINQVANFSKIEG